MAKTRTKPTKKITPKLIKPSLSDKSTKSRLPSTSPTLKSLHSTGKACSKSSFLKTSPIIQSNFKSKYEGTKLVRPTKTKTQAEKEKLKEKAKSKIKEQQKQQLKSMIKAEKEASEQTKFGHQLTLGLSRDKRIQMKKENQFFTEPSSGLCKSEPVENKAPSLEVDQDKSDQSGDSEISSEHKSFLKKKHKKIMPGTIQGFNISETWIMILLFLILTYFGVLLFFSFFDFIFAVNLWIKVGSKQFILKDFIFRQMSYLTLVLSLFEMATSAFSFFSFLRCWQINESEEAVFAVEKVYKFMKLSRWLNIFLTFAFFMIWIISIYTVEPIEKAVDKNLKESIDKYSQDLKIKKELNSLQLTHQCCGVESYKDWLFKPWYEKSNTPPVYGKITGHFEDVPFSCCKRDILTYCVYYDIQKKSINYKNQPFNLLSINKKGCAKVIAQELKSLSYFKGLAVLISGLTLIILRTIETNFYTNKVLKSSPVSYIFCKKSKF